jgi:hypothetical protein
MKYSALLLAGALLAGTVFTQNAFAHTFSGDESASFLATVEVIKTHLQLVQDDFETNSTNAQEHAEHAAEHLSDDLVDEISERNERLGRELPASLADLSESLSNSTAQQVGQKIANINDLLAETVSVRIESQQMDNVTMQALVIANLADEVLEAYSGAYGVESEEHEDHGSHEGNMTHEEETGSAAENMTGDEMTMNESDGMAMNQSAGMNASDTIVDMMHYESAVALASSMQAYYNATLKPLASANDTSAVAALEAGMTDLKSAIQAKEPLADVEVLVHTQVHANLQKAYNLQIVPEFPLPALMAVATIGGVIALTRLRRR